MGDGDRKRTAVDAVGRYAGDMAKHKDTGREMVQCRRCGGSGFTRVSRGHVDSKGRTSTVQDEIPCPDCGGSGRIQA